MVGKTITTCDITQPRNEKCENFAEKSNYINNKVLIVEPKDNEGKFSEPDEEDCNSDVISELVGHYGWWQFLWTFVLCMFQFPSTFHLFSFVFEGASKDFWCARPDHLKDISIDLWRNLTQPKDSCTIVDYNFNKIQSHNFSLGSMNIIKGLDLVKCQSYEYDNSLIGKTVISEWSLVCDKAYLVSVVEMCFLAGAAVGSICSGWISDRFGRRHTLLGFATVQTIIGLILAFSSSLPMFMTLRFISGVSSMAVLVVSFVLVVELVSGKWRTIIGILNLFPITICYIIIAGISYVTHDWRKMQLVGAVPCFLLLLLWFYLPESPRWLLVRGRIDDLKILIERIAHRNNITLPINFEKMLIPPLECEGNIQFSDLFKGKFRRTTILMTVIWFSAVLLYFGITLHMNNLGGNIFTNTIIAGSVEGLSILFSILVVLKLGIRNNLVIYMLIAGLACLMVNFVPDGNLWLIITLVMIGKCTIGATNAIIQTFTAYQYPTIMRNLGVGVGNFAAGVALIIIPYLWLLEHIQIFMPMTIMGCFGIIGAVALLLLHDRCNDMKKNKTQKRINNVCPVSSIKFSSSDGIENSAYKNNE